MERHFCYDLKKVWVRPGGKAGYRMGQRRKKLEIMSKLRYFEIVETALIIGRQDIRGTEYVW